MTIKSRLEKLEAEKAQAEKPTKSAYTQAQWEESLQLFEETFGVKLETARKAVTI